MTTAESTAKDQKRTLVILAESTVKDQKRTLVFDNEKCAGCGICVGTCPSEDLLLGPVGAIKRGLVEGSLISHKDGECSLCGLCSALCVYGALELHINGEKQDLQLDLLKTSLSEFEIEFNEENCVYCKICEDVCPTEAIEVTRHPIELKFDGTITVNSENCVGCEKCVEVCNTEAISVTRETSFYSEPKIEISIDASKCNFCLSCELVCPNDVINVNCVKCSSLRNLKEKPKITGDWSIDKNKCVLCGRCAIYCSTDALKVVKPISGELIIDISKCPKDCTTCVDICPTKSLYFPPKRSPFDKVELQFIEDHCNFCGVCINACKDKAIYIKNRTIGKMKLPLDSLWIRWIHLL